MAVAAVAGSGPSQEPETPSESLIWMAGTQVLQLSSLASQAQEQGAGSEVGWPRFKAFVLMKTSHVGD